MTLGHLKLMEIKNKSEHTSGETHVREKSNTTVLVLFTDSDTIFEFLSCWLLFKMDLLFCFYFKHCETRSRSSDFRKRLHVVYEDHEKNTHLTRWRVRILTLGKALQCWSEIIETSAKNGGSGSHKQCKTLFKDHMVRLKIVIIYL